MLELNEILKENADYSASRSSSKSNEERIKNNRKRRDEKNKTIKTQVNGDWFFTSAKLRRGVSNSTDDIEDETITCHDVCENAALILVKLREKRLQSLQKRIVIVFSLMLTFTLYSLVIGRSNLDPGVFDMQMMPNVDPVTMAQRFAEIQHKIRACCSSLESLIDETSPQFFALDWIANRDTYYISVDDPLLTQRYALAVLYFSTFGGSGWKQKMKWLSGTHECNWKGQGGVRKCNEQNEVIDLSLWNGLVGTIPSELMQLSKLEVLYLARNTLSGTIPTEIANLKNLQYLGLQHNKLTGKIPLESFRSLTSLKYLHLQKNDFTGTIRRVDFPCLLLKDQSKHDTNEEMDSTTVSSVKGKLEYFSADCRSLLSITKPEITCACCTECYLA